MGNVYHDGASLMREKGEWKMKDAKWKKEDTK
jgi:hypothetical protein